MEPTANDAEETKKKPHHSIYTPYSYHLVGHLSALSSWNEFHSAKHSSDTLCLHGDLVRGSAYPRIFLRHFRNTPLQYFSTGKQVTAIKAQQGQWCGQ